MQQSNVSAFSLPFDEAIAFLRRKGRVTSRAWTDIWQAANARAFTVAGAASEDLVDDFFKAIDRAIADGTTLAEFRKDFDRIVESTGWQYKGGRNWRSAVIFNTNLSTAYAAGHWQAMTDPDVVKVRPYLRYVPSHSAERRPEHVSWYNTVLPYDDPWWKTHYPPNGWGCKCGCVNLSEREVQRLEEEFADTPFPLQFKAPEIEYYRWQNPGTGKTIQVPRGIDPGWDYNVGEEAWQEAA